ncbi:class I SAM-dependent methyltransferase [Flavobacteriaceae bacterium]|nr:class I SAM-dependent methyltransferase [Flavobacteriaceae bacterium]
MNSLKLKTNDKLLDVGCGTGRFLSKLSKDVKYDLEIHGCDISNESLKLCRASIPGGTFNLHDLSDALNPILPKFYFDKIISVQVIQHLEPDKHKIAINKILNCLKPEGLLILELYNHSGLIRKFEQFINNSRHKEIQNGVFYEYRFNYHEIKKIIKEIDENFNVRIKGCQCIPRFIIKRFPFLKKIDIYLSKSFIGKYISYYFIAEIYKER